MGEGKRKQIIKPGPFLKGDIRPGWQPRLSNSSPHLHTASLKQRRSRRNPDSAWLFSQVVLGLVGLGQLGLGRVAPWSGGPRPGGPRPGGPPPPLSQREEPPR